MFAGRYFSKSYFAGRYFPPVVTEDEGSGGGSVGIQYGYFPHRYFARGYFPNEYFPGQVEGSAQPDEALIDTNDGFGPTRTWTRRARKIDSIREDILAAERRLLGLDNKLDQVEKSIQEAAPIEAVALETKQENLSKEIQATETRLNALERIATILERQQDEEDVMILLASLPFTRIQ